MLKPFDTNSNIPESRATLLKQQQRLLAGKRHVQMFPRGTQELNLPKGMCRIECARGVFHYNPETTTKEEILSKSKGGRENEFLELGPYSKDEILVRILLGENLICVTEYTSDGIEVRAAAGTNKTAQIQKEFFEDTKDEGNFVVVGPLPDRVRKRGLNYGG